MVVIITRLIYESTMVRGTATDTTIHQMVGVASVITLCGHSPFARWLRALGYELSAACSDV